MKGDVHKFYIPGKPIAKKRPRFVTNTGKDGKSFTRNVNVQQTEEGRFLWEVLTQWDNKPALTGALKLECEFVFERPKSHFGTGRNAGKLKASSPLLCDKVSSDCDNIEKFCMDSLNRYVYVDDRQIVKLSSEKRWAEDGEIASVVLIFTELD